MITTGWGVRVELGGGDFVGGADGQGVGWLVEVDDYFVAVADFAG